MRWAQGGHKRTKRRCRSARGCVSRGHPRLAGGCRWPGDDTPPSATFSLAKVRGRVRGGVLGVAAQPCTPAACGPQRESRRQRFARRAAVLNRSIKATSSALELSESPCQQTRLRLVRSTQSRANGFAMPARPPIPAFAAGSGGSQNGLRLRPVGQFDEPDFGLPARGVHLGIADFAVASHRFGQLQHLEKNAVTAGVGGQVGEAR